MPGAPGPSLLGTGDTTHPSPPRVPHPCAAPSRMGGIRPSPRRVPPVPRSWGPGIPRSRVPHPCAAPSRMGGIRPIPTAPSALPEGAGCPIHAQPHRAWVGYHPALATPSALPGGSRVPIHAQPHRAWVGYDPSQPPHPPYRREPGAPSMPGAGIRPSSRHPIRPTGGSRVPIHAQPHRRVPPVPRSWGPGIPPSPRHPIRLTGGSRGIHPLKPPPPQEGLQPRPSRPFFPSRVCRIFPPKRAQYSHDHPPPPQRRALFPVPYSLFPAPCPLTPAFARFYP